MADSLSLETTLERYELALDSVEKSKDREEGEKNWLVLSSANPSTISGRDGRWDRKVWSWGISKRSSFSRQMGGSEWWLNLCRLVLEVLLARNSVQTALEDSKSISTLIFLKLEEQDARLRKHRTTIHRVVSDSNWCSLMNPPPEAWWWYLEPPTLFPCLEKPHPILDKLDGLWKFFTIVTLAISITFIINTLQRILAGGSAITGIFAVMIQTTLGLAGGSALTNNGREVLESMLQLVRIPKNYWRLLGTCLSALFLCVVFCTHSFYLPYFASELYKDGLQQYELGKLGSAMSSYQQAIALQPDYVEVHLAMGVLFETLQQSEKAIKEYQQAIQGKSASSNSLSYLITVNRLGRLYILNKKYYDGWIVLEQGLRSIDKLNKFDRKDEEALAISSEKYNILKNIGWLRFKEKNYIVSSDYLKQAMELNEDFAEDQKRSSAYCLYVQLLEETNQNQEITPYIKKCMGYTVSSDPDEAIGSAMAEEKLSKMEKK
jgi:tetratricopeptide (TPR) repeat protein